MWGKLIDPWQHHHSAAQTVCRSFEAESGRLVGMVSSQVSSLGALGEVGGHVQYGRREGTLERARCILRLVSLSHPSPPTHNSPPCVLIGLEESCKSRPTPMCTRTWLARPIVPIPPPSFPCDETGSTGGGRLGRKEALRIHVQHW